MRPSSSVVRTPAFHAGNAGSNPAGRIFHLTRPTIIGYCQNMKQAAAILALFCLLASVPALMLFNMRPSPPPPAPAPAAYSIGQRLEPAPPYYPPPVILLERGALTGNGYLWTVRNDSGTTYTLQSNALSGHYFAPR